MTNKQKVITFTAKEIERDTQQPKQEQRQRLKKLWLWLKNLFSKRYLINYIVFTGTQYIPFKDVVTTNKLNEMMLEPQIMIYSVVGKRYLSTIHKKVVDSDEKINSHTDVTEQLLSSHNYDKFG